MKGLLGDVIAHVRGCVLNGEWIHIAADTRLVEDLQAESLDLMSIVDCLERAYRIRISDEEFDGVRTVGDIVAMIHAKRGLRTIPVVIEKAPVVDPAALVVLAEKAG